MFRLNPELATVVRACVVFNKFFVSILCSGYLKENKLFSSGVNLNWFINDIKAINTSREIKQRKSHKWSKL